MADAPPSRSTGRPRRRGVPEGHLAIHEIGADFARRERDLLRRAADRGMTRREFLAFLAAAGAVSAAGAARAAPGATAGPVPAERSEAGLPAGAPPAAAPAKSRVVVVRNPEVLVRGYRANPPVVRQMLDRAVLELTGAKTEAAAWQTVAREGDFVAVKHNTMGYPTLHSHAELNDAVSVALVDLAKVKVDSVLVVDRMDVPKPYDEFSEPFTLPSNRIVTRLRRLYTDKATAIVNISVLKTHFGEGISGALKNHLGSVNNPAAYHGWQPGEMPRNLPELNALEPLRTKTRLCILDAIRPLFAGGPADDEAYRWDFHGLIVGTDPVAVTAVGMRILEAKRAESRGKPWPMTAARQLVAYAQKIGLGAADPERIDLVEVKAG